MNKKRLTAEQVAAAIAVNRLLPDPPGGFDMQGIADDLNKMLDDAAAGEPAIEVEPIQGAALAEFIRERGGEQLSREMSVSQPPTAEEKL